MVGPAGADFFYQLHQQVDARVVLFKDSNNVVASVGAAFFLRSSLSILAKREKLCQKSGQGGKKAIILLLICPRGAFCGLYIYFCVN